MEEDLFCPTCGGPVEEWEEACPLCGEMLAWGLYGLGLDLFTEGEFLGFFGE